MWVCETKAWVTFRICRAERREVPEIEQQRPALEEEVDVEPRIPERVVDQPGMEEGLHEKPGLHAYRSTQ
jgi:hypothetical protein